MRSLARPSWQKTAWLLVFSLLPAAPTAAQEPPARDPFRAPPTAGSPAAPPDTLRERSGPVPPGALYIAEQPGNALLVTEYLGRSVYGPDKQKVGSISNLLVDTTGRIIGVVLDVGGFLGFGAKEVAISFEALFPVRENDEEAFLVEMSKAQLTAAPAFKRSR
jgi:PRC-barrel domain